MHLTISTYCFYTKTGFEDPLPDWLKLEILISLGGFQILFRLLNRYGAYVTLDLIAQLVR